MKSNNIESITMNFREILGITTERVISVVGAGGKTSLIFGLAKELSSTIVTTTTKMHLPKDISVIWYQGDLKSFQAEVENGLLKEGKVFIAQTQLEGNKVQGVAPELIDFLHEAFPKEFILVEADGSARKPFKAPAEWEPVVAKSTELVVVIVGDEILGKKLTSDNCHRLELVQQLTGLEYGEEVTLEAIDKVLSSLKGYGHERFRPARVCYLINRTKRFKEYTLFRKNSP